MPTGYTADIIDGKISTAQEFAQLCARAFMHNMRDTSMGAPLRYPERYDSYYAEELPNRMAELVRWDNLTEEEKYVEWSEYAERQAERAAEAAAEATENYNRLIKVLTEVKKIPVPETHKNFKQFMVEQLEETIKFDATFKEDWYAVTPYEEWVDGQRRVILRGIETASEGLHKAEENYQQSRKWIGTLAKTYGLEIQE